MGRKKKSLDKIIKDKISERMADEIIEEVEEDLPPRSSSAIPEATLEEMKDISELIRTVPDSENFYFKVYKTKPLPSGTNRPQFKTEITDLKSVDDLEVYVRNLARDNRWGPGEYLVCLFSKSKIPIPSGVKPLRLNIDYQQPEEPDAKVREAPSIDDELTRMSTFMKGLQSILPNSTETAGEIARAVSESFRQGVAVTKENLPPPVDPTTTLSAVITTLKDLGIVGKPDHPKFDVLDIVEKVANALKTFGIFDRKEEKKDIFAELLKLKELGLIKIAGEEKKEDPFDMIEKVKSLMELLTPLTQQASGEKPSLGVELVRILGPHVPEMVKNVTATVDNVANLSRQKLQSNLMGPGHPGPIPPMPSSLPQRQPVPTSSVEETENTMLEALNNISLAIKTNDYNFFPKLEEYITLFYGGHSVASLVEGTVQISTIAGFVPVHMMGGVTKAEIIAFLEQFVEWKRTQLKENLLIARCEQCGEEYEFISLHEFESDTKECELCGGRIVFIPKEVPRVKPLTTVEAEEEPEAEEGK